MTLKWNLEGKVALVTGATRGIGWETVKLLASCGADVVLTGVSNEQKLLSCAEELKQAYGVQAFGVLCDVSDATAVKECYATVHKTFGRLDILVNNAGIIDNALVSMTKPHIAQRLVEVNMLGVVYNIQYASRLMARNRAGAIVNLSSLSGLEGQRGQVVYSGTKAGVLGMTRAAAKELAAMNIRVNAVAPGYVETEMVADLSDDQREEVVSKIFTGRFGRPDEIAQVILFLASDMSSYITGEVIRVDGGYGI